MLGILSVNYDTILTMIYKDRYLLAFGTMSLIHQLSAKIVHLAQIGGPQ